MARILDARGLACPAPVLMTKDAVDKGDLKIVTVIVDNDASRENVSRFLESQQFSVKVSREGDDYKIVARRSGDAAASLSEPALSVDNTAGRKPKIMIMVATDRFGYGDEDLGKKLIISFIKTIKEMGDELWKLIFVNNGVKLTIDGSPVLEDLTAYEEEGLSILVCGTCLLHFDLLEAKKVGETTNMLDIVTAMQLADKVINI